MPSIRRILAVSLSLVSAVAAASAADRVEAAETFKGVKKLVVDASHVDVAAASGAAVLRAEPVAFDPAREKLFASRSGAVLTLRVETVPRVFDFTARRAPRLLIELPSGVEVELRSASGEIDLFRHDADRISVEASSGDVELKSCSGDIRVSTSSGSIRGIDLEGAVEVSASSGDVELKDVRGLRSVRTVSGSAKLDSTEGDIELSTSSGEAVLRRHDGDVRGTTVSGGFSLFGVAGRLDLESSSGDIEGSDVELLGGSSFRTASGSVDLDLRNRSGDLSFELRAASGALRALGEETDRGRLSVGSGSVAVRGSSSSGDQSYRAR